MDSLELSVDEGTDAIGFLYPDAGFETELRSFRERDLRFLIKAISAAIKGEGWGLTRFSVIIHSVGFNANPKTGSDPLQPISFVTDKRTDSRNSTVYSSPLLARPAVLLTIVV